MVGYTRTAPVPCASHIKFDGGWLGSQNQPFFLSFSLSFSLKDKPNSLELLILHRFLLFEWDILDIGTFFHLIHVLLVKIHVYI
jgi:hypothetical protein